MTRPPTARADAPAAARVLALGAMLFLAAPSLRAQAVLGLGEDATTPPAGALRAFVSNQWTRFAFGANGGPDTSFTNDSRIRTTMLNLELGLTPRLAIAVRGPWVSTQSITTQRSLHGSVIAADDVTTIEHGGFGDVQGELKVVWLSTMPDRERYAPRGVHVRSALSAIGQLGMAAHLPTEPFALGTGTGAHAVEGRSQTDVIVGERFWASIVARYTHPFADQAVVRVTPPGQPYSTLYAPFAANRRLGDALELEATPRVGLGRYFAIGAQYRYRHKFSDAFSGTADTTINGTPVTLDASTLDTESALTEQFAGLGVVYSSVDAFLAGHARLPIEVGYQYAHQLTSTSGRPKTASHTIFVRVWQRLWGGGFARR